MTRTHRSGEMMREPFPQKIKPEELRLGDHIYTWRLLHTYSHHGIYVGEDVVGEGVVIHFVNQNEENGSTGSEISSTSSTRERSGHQCPRNDNGVLRTCLDCFLKGGDLYRYLYGEKIGLIIRTQRGTCTSAPSDPVEDVIDRAKYLHQNGYGEYNLMVNNCEDFALYCKTGLMSRYPIKQGRSSQVYSVLGRVMRVFNDLGYRTDVTKVEVEGLAEFLRQRKEKEMNWLITWCLTCCHTFLQPMRVLMRYIVRAFQIVMGKTT